MSRTSQTCLMHLWKLPAICDDSLECGRCGASTHLVPRSPFHAAIEDTRRRLFDPVDDHEDRERANLAARILGRDVYAMFNKDDGCWTFYGAFGPEAYSWHDP